MIRQLAHTKYAIGSIAHQNIYLLTQNAATEAKHSILQARVHELESLAAGFADAGTQLFWVIISRRH